MSRSDLAFQHSPKIEMTKLPLPAHIILVPQGQRRNQMDLQVTRQNFEAWPALAS